MQEQRTFFTRSKSPPVAKVSLPKSSTVTAESFESTRPAAKGWPGLLQETGHGVLILLKNVQPEGSTKQNRITSLRLRI